MRILQSPIYGRPNFCDTAHYHKLRKSYQTDAQWHILKFKTGGLKLSKPNEEEKERVLLESHNRLIKLKELKFFLKSCFDNPANHFERALTA